MTGSKLKVVIVDDEHLVRDLLKKCLDWGELGCDMAGEASCAQEALELIDEIVPDIVITDIHMPYMDGIELSRLVLAKYPFIKVVVLTGYEEFEYAKRSISIGIADFLLKPVNEEEIKKAVLGLSERIQSEKSHRMEYSRMKRDLEKNLPFLRERLLNELILNNFDEAEIAQRLEYFRIAAAHDHCQAAVIDFSFPEGSLEVGEEQRVFLGMQGMDMVSQYFRDNKSLNVFFDYRRRIVILSSDREMDLTESLEVVKAMLVNGLKCFVCIGVGGVSDSLKKIALSYKEACNALEYRVVAGKNQVICYSDINSSTQDTFRMNSSLKDSLAFFLRAGIKGRALELLDDIFSEGALGHGTSIDSIRAAASNMVSTVLNTAAEAGISIQEVLGSEGQPFDRIFSIDTFPEMKEYLVRVISALTDVIYEMQSKRVNQAIRQVREYIMQNLYDSGLTLSNTAKAFYMNLSYLSRIFKQETGQTFIDYVTRARIEKAVKLLRETDKKAYQIAEEVGIVDPHYFGICFKKFTGMSVNDFKKTLVH